MRNPLLVIGLSATVFLFGCADHSTPEAKLKKALVGSWFLDVDGTADATARSYFGVHPSVIQIPPRTRGQPPTFRTNFVERPFNQQEFEQLKQGALAGWQAAGTMSMRMTFAADGTGKFWGMSSADPQGTNQPFQWRLQGTTLTVNFAGSSGGVQTEFTNLNHFHFDLPAKRVSLAFKPAASKR